MSKATQQRFCPAVQREISSAECGENRQSKYACPADCEFNPFAPQNYDTYFELEGRVLRKSYDWYVASSKNRVEAQRMLDQMTDSRFRAARALQVTEVFLRRDASGRTCAERWGMAGFPGLKNDERVLQRAAMDLQLRLIEVHRVLDDRRVGVVDLMEADPQPYILIDRSLAAQACRFSTMLGWFFPLPHYLRCSGFAVPMTPVAGLDPLGVVAELVRHLGGPVARSKWSEWFGGNFPRFEQAREAVAHARHQQMLATLDADFGKAVYELRAPFSECRAVLDAEPDVDVDELTDAEMDEGFAEGRVWFEPMNATIPQPGPAQVLGRVLLGQAHWRAEAIGAERTARLRAKLEALLGSRVRFTGERRDNLAAQLRAQSPTYDPSLVPPRLLEEPPRVRLAATRMAVPSGAGGADKALADHLAEYDRQWLDAPVPALRNLTPRAAALDPQVRPVLLRLLKERVRQTDERARETGMTVDCNWLLRELGAHELIFDPPPLPPGVKKNPAAPPAPDDNDDEDDVDEEDFIDDLEPWPRLPPGPFSVRQAGERLRAGVERYESAAVAREAAKKAGCLLLEDLPDLVGDGLTDSEISFMVPALLQTWFAFVPPGCFGPEIAFEELQAALGKLLDRLDDAFAQYPDSPLPPGRLVELIGQGPQPTMTSLLADQVLQQYQDMSGKDRPRASVMPLILMLLAATIEVLDRKCREGILDDDEDDSLEHDNDLKPWPRLPPRPFNAEELAARLHNTIGRFASARAANDALEAAGCFLLEDLLAVVKGRLTESEFSHMAGQIIETWFAFVPLGCFGPEIRFEELEAAFGQQLLRLKEVLTRQASADESAKFLIEEGPQPELMALLASQLLRQAEELPAKQRPRPEVFPLMLMLLALAIEVLDRKCRGEHPDDDAA